MTDVCCSMVEEAAKYGHLECLKYQVENCGSPVCAHAAMVAVQYGQIRCLKYLHEKCDIRMCAQMAEEAAWYGYLHCLVYLIEECNVSADEDATTAAASGGHIVCLKYLVEEHSAPINAFEAAEQTVTFGYSGIHCTLQNKWLQCLGYLAEVIRILGKFDSKDVLRWAHKYQIYVSDEWCLVPGCGRRSTCKRALCQEHVQEYARILMDNGLCRDTAGLIAAFA